MRTLKIHIKRSHPDYREALRQMQISKNLYNQANFIARQTYFHYCGKKYTLTNNKTLDDWILGNNYNGNMNSLSRLRKPLTQYVRINSKIAQAILRNLANNWQSFFSSKKANFPRYKKKQYGLVPYSIQAISRRSLRDGIIKPSGFKRGIQLPKWFDPNSTQACCLICKNGQIWLLIIYNETQKIQIKQSNTIAAIDFGVDALIAMAYSDNSSPIVVKDRRIKTWNQLWNKTVALRKQGHKHYWGKFLDSITAKRNLRIEQVINRTANIVVSELVKHKISKLILGKNDGWKQNVNIGKRNNQTFVQIPFAKLINNITYKARSIGINVVTQEESYTSKASFVSLDPIPVFDVDNSNIKYKFSGKRKHRGMYEDGNTRIHADINAAFNIMRKNQENEAIKIWGGKTNIQPLGIKLYS